MKNIDLIKQAKFKRACAIYSETGEEFGLDELQFSPPNTMEPWKGAPEGIEDFVNDKISEDELRTIARTLIQQMSKVISTVEKSK